MVNFIKPSFLGTEKEFANLYATPIKNGQHKDSSKAEIKYMKQRSYVLHKKLSKFVQVSCCWIIFIFDSTLNFNIHIYNGFLICSISETRSSIVEIILTEKIRICSVHSDHKSAGKCRSHQFSFFFSAKVIDIFIIYEIGDPVSIFPRQQPK